MKIRKSIFALIALAVLMVSVVSCAPAPTPAPVVAASQPTTAPVAAATVAPTVVPPKPAAPKVVRFRVSRDPKTLEPGLFTELITGYIANDLHAGLLKFDDKMQPSAFIAKSWQVSADGMTYTFALRDDVKFHNGRKVVADDFVYSFTRILDPKVKAAAGPAYLGTVKGAKDFIAAKATSVEGLVAVDPATFKIVLTAPDATFPQKLSSVFLGVIPKEAVVDGAPQWKDKPVGAGAFKYVDWQTNVKVVLEANPDFFLGRPKIDRLEYVVVPDVTTAMAQYQAGELDIIDVRGGQLAQVNKDATLTKELGTFARAQLTFFVLNEKRVAAFKDKRVRQAFNYAVNRQELIDKVLLGDRFLATGYVPTGIPEAVADEKAYPFDPVKAKDLMTQAGFPGGQGFPKIEFVTTSDEQTLAEALTAQLKTNLGVDVAVRIGESGDVLSGLWDRGKWDIVSWGWSADYPSAEVWLYQLLYSKMDSNFASYASPDYDKLVDSAQAQMDSAKRITAWQAAEKMAYDDAPMIPFGYAKYLYLVKPYVKGFGANMVGPKQFQGVDVVK